MMMRLTTFFLQDPVKTLQQLYGDRLHGKDSWSPLAYGFGLDKNLILLLKELRPNESSRIGYEYLGASLLIDDWDRTADLFMPESWLESSPKSRIEEMPSLHATAEYSSDRNPGYFGKHDFVPSHEILSLITLYNIVARQDSTRSRTTKTIA
jgi:hypothetical protein